MRESVIEREAELTSVIVKLSQAYKGGHRCYDNVSSGALTRGKSLVT